MKRALVVVALSLIFMSSAQAASSIVLNGSFEEDQGIPVGTWTTVNAGITDWTVGGANVDWIGTYWTASDGNRSLDLNGKAAGSVAQTFTTIANEWYRVTFDMAANPDGGPAEKWLRVSFDGVTQDFKSSANPKLGQWDTISWDFQALDGSTELVFTSLMNTANDNGWGPALDNVSVTLIRDTPAVVPAPGALLLGSLGAAMVGFVRRRTLRA